MLVRTISTVCSHASTSRSTMHGRIPRTIACSRTNVLPIRRTLVSSEIRKAQVQPGPALSPANKAEITLRRFWKEVQLKEELDGFLVMLDNRTLKTPRLEPLLIPKEKRLLATMLAAEWENQSDMLKPSSLELFSLASRAIDGFRDGRTRHEVIEKLLRYLETDTILYIDHQPAALEKLQRKHWDPLFSWSTQELGIELLPAEGFQPARQTRETIEKLRKVVEAMNPWELAAFERAVYSSKSFIIALALCRGRLTADQAADAAHVEVRSQIEQWGEVEDTHDVEYQDIRKSLGSAACLLIHTP